MGLLSEDDKVFIQGCMDEIAPDIEEPVTYKVYTGVTPGDPVTGVPDTPNYTNYSITAKAQELTLEEVRVSGGAYLLGDFRFKIRSSALLSPPAYADLIVYNGANYKPKNIGHDFLGQIIDYVIVARKE